MATLQQIIAWFQTGLFPTANQFRQTWLSFWHKSEKIPQSQIFGLQETIESVTRGLIYQNPVPTKSALSTTYPSPQVGWAAMVLDERYIYSWNGTSWANTGLRAFPDNIVIAEDLEDFISRTGTEIGKNITGNIVFDPQASLSSQNGATSVQISDAGIYIQHDIAFNASRLSLVDNKIDAYASQDIFLITPMAGVSIDSGAVDIYAQSGISLTGEVSVDSTNTTIHANNAIDLSATLIGLGSGSTILNLSDAGIYLQHDIAFNASRLSLVDNKIDAYASQDIFLITPMAGVSIDSGTVDIYAQQGISLTGEVVNNIRFWDTKGISSSSGSSRLYFNGNNLNAVSPYINVSADVLNISGDTNFHAGEVQFNSHATFEGGATFGYEGEVRFNGYTRLDGETYFGSSAIFQNETYFQSDVHFDGISARGNLSFSDSVEFGSEVRFQSSLIADSELKSNSEFYANISYLEGETYFRGNIYFSDIEAGGRIRFTDNVDFAAIYVGDWAYFLYQAEFSDSAYFRSQVQVDGELDVSGNAYFSNESRFDGGLIADGEVAANSGLYSYSGLYAYGEASCYNGLSVDGYYATFSCYCDAYFYGSINLDESYGGGSNIYGKAYFQDYVSFQHTQFGGEAYFASDTQFDRGPYFNEALNLNITEASPNWNPGDIADVMILVHSGTAHAQAIMRTMTKADFKAWLNS